MGERRRGLSERDDEFGVRSLKRHKVETDPEDRNYADNGIELTSNSCCEMSCCKCAFGFGSAEMVDSDSTHFDHGIDLLHDHIELIGLSHSDFVKRLPACTHCA